MAPISAKKHLLCTLLLLVMLSAILLRLWRLDFGLELPYLAHTDEPRLYNSAVRIIQSGDLNPHDFYKPSLAIYLDALVMFVGFTIGRVCGIYQSLADLRPIEVVNWSVGLVGTPDMLLLGRATSAMFGSLTVGLVFVATRELTSRKWVPLLTAMLLALSSFHIRLSHYMSVDVIATFFAVASVTASTIALNRKDRRYLWAAALCGGLAASSKYNYAVLAVSVGLASLIYPSPWIDRVKHTVLCGFLFCLGFGFTSPYVLLDYPRAIHCITYEIRHYSSGHPGMAGSSLSWYLTFLWNINPFYLLLGVPGMFLALTLRRRGAWPIAAFTIVYFGLIARQAVHFDRNVLPVMVLLIVMLGFAVEALLDIIPARVRDWRVGVKKAKLSPVVLAAILIPLLPCLVALPGFLQPPSSSGKAMAQAWFNQILQTPVGQRYLYKDGDLALKTVAEAYTSYLDPRECWVNYLPTITQFRGGLSELRDNGYDVAILGSGMFNRYYDSPDSFAREVNMYDELFEQVPGVMAFENEATQLEFIRGGSNVYVLFMSERAKQFEMEAKLSAMN